MRQVRWLGVHLAVPFENPLREVSRRAIHRTSNRRMTLPLILAGCAVAYVVFALLVWSWCAMAKKAQQ